MDARSRIENLLYVAFAVHRIKDINFTLKKMDEANQFDLFEKERTVQDFQNDRNLAAAFKTNFSQFLENIPDAKEEQDKKILVIIVEWNMGHSGENISVFDDIYAHIKKELANNPKIKNYIVFTNGSGLGQEGKDIYEKIQEEQGCFHLSKNDAAQQLQKFREQHKVYAKRSSSTPRLLLSRSSSKSPLSPLSPAGQMFSSTPPSENAETKKPKTGSRKSKNPDKTNSSSPAVQMFPPKLPAYEELETEANDDKADSSSRLSSSASEEIIKIQENARSRKNS